MRTSETGAFEQQLQEGPPLSCAGKRRYRGPGGEEAEWSQGGQNAWKAVTKAENVPTRNSDRRKKRSLSQNPEITNVLTMQRAKDERSEPRV